MNYIYLISGISIFIGFMLLTIYIVQINTDCSVCFSKTEPTENIYNVKPKKIFNKMFNEPSIWQGYQSVDEEIYK